MSDFLFGREPDIRFAEMDDDRNAQIRDIPRRFSEVTESDSVLEFLVGANRLNVGSTWRKRRVSAPFYSLFCRLRSVLHRRPIFVGAADIFSFILAPLIGPILRMVHIEFAVDDGESLRIDCIFVAALV